MISNDALVESLFRFVKEHDRYPSKKECSEIDYLFGYNTYFRKLGCQEDWNIIEALYNLNPKRCDCCGKELLFSKRLNRFCDRSCAATHNNSMRKTTKYCHCGNELNSCQSTYCSISCHKEKVYTDRKLYWLNTGCFQSNKMIKRYLTDLCGYSCNVCGISEWNDMKLSLEVDHIDGHNDDCRFSNVRLICPNCHSQTETYKAKNKGNGRVSRMERYRLNKSY